MSKPRLAYDTYIDLIQQIDALVTALEQHPDEATREQVLVLLGGLDTLHREGLTRLIGLLRATGADALLQQAQADPIVKTLLGLYDLAELDLPKEQPAPYPGMAGFIPLEGVLATAAAPNPGRAVWTEVARTSEVPPGRLHGCAINGLRVLLANVDGEIYGFRNACAGTELTLEMGHLAGHELICPWHGCRYDARTGRRLDGGPGRLEVFPVAVRGESIQLAQQGTGGHG